MCVFIASAVVHAVKSRTHTDKLQHIEATVELELKEKHPCSWKMWTVSGLGMNQENPPHSPAINSIQQLYRHDHKWRTSWSKHLYKYTFGKYCYKHKHFGQNQVKMSYWILCMIIHSYNTLIIQIYIFFWSLIHPVNNMGFDNLLNSMIDCLRKICEVQQCRRRCVCVC